MITAQRANVFNPFKSLPPAPLPAGPSGADYGTFANHPVIDEILTAAGPGKGTGNRSASCHPSVAM